MERLRSDPMLLAVTMLFFSRFTAIQFGADLSSQQEIFVFIGFLALRGPAAEADGNARLVETMAPASQGMVPRPMRQTR